MGDSVKRIVAAAAMVAILFGPNSVKADTIPGSSFASGEWRGAAYDKDRKFSHCARKIPRDGDYRVQSMYGGREEVYNPTTVELDAAQRVLAAVSFPLLYARVDMMRGQDGHLALMELELIEPYLYPEQGLNWERLFVEELVGLMS